MCAEAFSIAYERRSIVDLCHMPVRIGFIHGTHSVAHDHDHDWRPAVPYNSMALMACRSYFAKHYRALHFWVDESAGNSSRLVGGVGWVGEEVA